MVKVQYGVKNGKSQKETQCAAHATNKCVDVDHPDLIFDVHCHIYVFNYDLLSTRCKLLRETRDAVVAVLGSFCLKGHQVLFT